MYGAQRIVAFEQKLMDRVDPGELGYQACAAQRRAKQADPRETKDIVQARIDELKLA